MSIGDATAAAVIILALGGALATIIVACRANPRKNPPRILEARPLDQRPRVPPNKNTKRIER